MRTGKRRGCLANLFGLVILCVAVAYVVAAITSPWAFHIGGQFTPLLYWSGTGKLVTKSGSYPLYVTLFPGAHFSRLRLDGLRPTGGLQGSAWLCRSPGTTQYLKLSGTIYGGWRSTEGSVWAFGLMEPRRLNATQTRGSFSLSGKWNGPELVLSDRGGSGRVFRSGLKIEQASVTLDRSSYSEFQAMCGEQNTGH